MGVRSFINAYRARWRFARRDREWKRSARRKELDAERDLPPRPLSQEEHDLLCWILEHGSAEAKTFLPQVEGIRAVRACTCGCPTIRLVTAENAPAGNATGGNIVCDLLGRTPQGELVGILLFRAGGKISDLEIYSMDGAILGGSQEFGLPTIESLTEFEVGEPPASAEG